MTQRLDYRETNPQAMRGMFLLEETARHGGLEQSLMELMRMRASQINGWAYCLDMHSKDARAEGESEQHLYAFSAWRETPFFAQRERAVIAINGWNRLAIPFRTPPGLYTRAGNGHTVLG